MLYWENLKALLRAHALRNIRFSTAANILCFVLGTSIAFSAVGKVRIAINIPMTGPIAAWSGQFPNGFELGIEDACKKQHIDPKLFAVDVQDNAGKPSQAVSIFHKQSINGFDVYVTVTTGAANALSGQLDKEGKAHFIAAFDPFITKAGPSRLRVMANSKVEAPLITKYALSHKAKKVYILSLNFAYAEDEFGKIVEPDLKKAGVDVIRERFNLEDRDFKTVANKIKAAAPDLIVLSGYSFHLEPLLRDLRTYGLVKPGKVITSMDLVDLCDGGTPTEELQDVAFACPLFDVPGKVPGAAEWRIRYEKRFGTKPTCVPAYGYDNATMIVDAYAKTGKVDTGSLLKALPFDGVTGKIQLDQDRDIVSTMTVAEVTKDRKIVEVH